MSDIPDEQPAVQTPSSDGPAQSSDGPAPDGSEQEPSEPGAVPVDLDAVERDLTAVEVALNRLADGTYWTDEVTGQPIPEDVLVRDPLARRV